ncbi:hypothetical protein L3X38_022252 [Prunus dulcis]|uniref:Protein FAR1-RELATED SEQUENCE n=1 Tax=Prunus dulcis TaxID=3755 RepID=A0AAD4Z4E6_PRUDU|nr:hypothetical protein L3X38_022252 [Prunus dulcis]
MGVFNNCIYNSWTAEDFKQKWQNMVEVFELDNNEWIKSLFEDRKFWVPTYMRDAFFAGMSTTQRSESINSFFEKYVNKKTTLKEFVEKYKVALQDREEAATHADFKTLHKEPTLKSPSPFEKQIVDKENVNSNVLCDINVLDPRVSNTKGAPKRVKNQNSNGKKYNKKPKKAQANLGLSNDGIESSLPRQEQAHTRNDASDNYKDTHECLQQIDEYETLEGHNGMKVNMDWMEQLIHIREELHVKSGKMSSEVVYL